MAAIALIAGLTVGSPTIAEAATCAGINSRTIVTFDYSTGVAVEDIMIDSCKVKTLISKYGVVKDAAGLAGLLGAGFWPAGVTAGALFGWAWNNQSQLIGCSSGGRGVRLRQWAGLITGCYSQ
ncbi:hypothetical protein AB0E56_03470 [Microbacterium sp. NPDC028030]|uniref:hypothetical protein n=1 Tax=Microbacterium sp. NPDC028030 TaxID=3155124 RepID=UPI0033C4C78E